MVGGVSPGKGGKEHLGLPVFNSVADVSKRVVYIDLFGSQIVCFGTMEYIGSI